MSGYFSPNKRHRPRLFAWAIGMVDQLTGAASSTFRLTALFDGMQTFAADGFRIGEIEPQAVGLDLAASLLCVLAQNAVKRVVQQVGCRMGAADGLPPIGVNCAHEPWRSGSPFLPPRGRRAG